jgi:hypothetical protein
MEDDLNDRFISENSTVGTNSATMANQLEFELSTAIIGLLPVKLIQPNQARAPPQLLLISIIIFIYKK